MKNVSMVAESIPGVAPPSLNGETTPRASPPSEPYPHPPAHRKWPWILAIGLSFVGGWFAAGKFQRPAKDNLPPDTETVERDPAAVVVTVQPITQQSLQRTVEAIGTLHGFEEMVISSRVEGRVRKICFDVADQVEPGKLLLEIDPTDHHLAVQQAERALLVELAKWGFSKTPEAEVDLAKIPSVMQAQTRMDNAQLRYDRFRKLNPSGAVAREELETATSDLRAAQAEHAHQLLQAKSGLAMIQMKQTALDVAKQQLKDTQVRAPTPTQAIPGTTEGVVYGVTQRMVSEGTLVRPGTDIGKLILTQTLKLRVPIPERFSAEIRVGQKAEVFTAGFKHPFSGTVTRRNPAVDPLTRTLEVEIQIPNPKGELMPGSFAKVDIHTRLDEKSVAVPLSAVVQFAGINKVFLMENGRAKEVHVSLGEQGKEWIEITKPPLPPGAQVITSGQSVLAHDSPVVVR